MHETYHELKRLQLGENDFQDRLDREKHDYGYYGVYSTLGTLEWEADQFASDVIGKETESPTRGSIEAIERAASLRMGPEFIAADRLP